jgi:hypothetical protein
VDHGVVTIERVDTDGPNGLPEIIRSGPVSEPIDDAAVAEHDPRAISLSRGLQLALHVIDRSLRRTARADIVVTRKAAPKDDSGGFADAR